jgi:hypothetical protein
MTANVSSDREDVRRDFQREGRETSCRRLLEGYEE